MIGKIAKLDSNFFKKERNLDDHAMQSIRLNFDILQVQWAIVSK